ncbi:hypothetical protein RhiirA4_390149 [Rhizophagus irregularis]|uniref:Uncharacterized protein n=1 Tax=Rhizophagus irregularis TaxID=588596 RepID=A0A2I1FSB3_9GLOM|nr:hypothetical protein RhiirA4_390149 [Rhizophagus irregularis]
MCKDIFIDVMLLKQYPIVTNALFDQPIICSLTAIIITCSFMTSTGKPKFKIP